MNFRKRHTIKPTLLYFIAIIAIFFSACAKKTTPRDYTKPTIEYVPKANSTEISNNLDTTEVNQETAETETPPDGIEIPTIKVRIASQILKRLAYTLSYNKDTRCPNWVAWKLTAEHTDGPYDRHNYKFHDDPDVPVPRANYHDYSYNRLGLERGHMCPAADNKWSDKAMDECHLLSNICPQYGPLNGGEWMYLENDCREWAKDYKCIYIVCGPIFYSKSPKTIGEDKISVPDAFFKVILRLGNNPQALGFIYPNKSCSGGKAKYVKSVDEVEKMTGMDFFSSLDDNIENKIERTSNLDQWE